MSSPVYSQIPSTRNEEDCKSSPPGFLSTALFTWLSGIFAQGDLRPLEETDLFQAVDQRKSRDVSEQIQKLWTEETRTSRNPRIWRALLGLVTAREYTFHACSLLLLSLVRVSQPVLLNVLLRELVNEPTDLRWIAVYIVGLALAGVLAAFLKSTFYYAAGVAGAHFSTALTGLVYRKVLASLRAGKLGQLTSAHVINLVSKDLEPVFCGCHYIPQAVTGSVELLLIGFVLWRLVAAEAVAGMAVAVLVWTFQSAMKPLLQRLRSKTTLLTDQRLRLVSDVISGIRTLKMNAWEWVFKGIVDESRRKEIGVIRMKSAIEAIFIALQSSFATAATLVSMATMVAGGLPLTVQDVFTVYSLMSAARKPVLEDFARAVRYFAESLVTLKRVETLLNLSEDASTDAGQGDSGKNPLRLSDIPMLSSVNLTCEGNNNLMLNDVTLSFHGNQLVVIAGAVGSGKSSLLTAILGELCATRGQVFHDGELAYAPQKPWLFSGTVSQNILFGKTMNQTRYRETVDACALEADFDLLPDGDNTFIGERGVSLSGGQQSRINLARAVYSGADIYLLDDPLSAVDARVGRHIFERCILGRLSDTLRILVTHRVEYFQHADCIVVLQNGRVRCQGKYEELLTSDEYFAELVQNKKAASEEDENKKGPAVASVASAEAEPPSESEGFHAVEEDREVGSVTGHTYWTYVKAAMPIPCAVVAAVLIFLPDATSISANLWLAKLTKLSPEDQRKLLNFLIYATLAVGTFVISFTREFVLLFCALKAAERLHSKMLLSLLLAPVRFFDTNPSGRIMNRFSRSVGNMDEFLPIEGVLFIRFFAVVVTSVLLVSVVNPWVVFASVPFTAALICLAVYFLQTGRELKRLEAISCSPLYVQFAETIEGVAVIRACSMEDTLFDELCRYRDRVNSAIMIFVGAKQWMSLRAEVLSVLYVTVVASAVFLTSTDKALVGLSIAYSLDIASSVYLMLMEFAHTENFMTSVERVITYTNLEPEAGYQARAPVPGGWPRTGSVSFENVCFYYFPRGHQILKDVNFRVHDGERIGIVGRTGAGKSSLVSAIFRMPEPNGDISIDNVSINTLNLQLSRSAVAAISQNPLLFSGTLRFNLDPETKYGDKALWDVLADVSLKQLVQNLPDKLESRVTEGGGNLSVGERQLLCVARVLLQDKKIVVLDEATANVDMKTDRVLQDVIRSKLSGRTVLTIAHRLETILDYDKVLVMDAGKVVEFDDPRILLGRADSEFSRLYQCSMK